MTLVLGLGLIEITLRVIEKQPELYNERNTLYQYDSTIGWVPKPRYDGTYSYDPGRVVSITHNAMGFRDRDHFPGQRPVLAVVGDSYVYGFNVSQDERFTERLQSKRPDLDIYNFGVSGYGTDQELLVTEKMLSQIHPDAVLLIFCSNDHEDNSTNRRYGYYKPYVDMSGGKLDLKGIPVPKCLLYYSSAHPTLFKSRLISRVAEVVWRPLAMHYWPVLHVPDPTGPLLMKMRGDVERSGATFAIGFIGYGPDEKSFCAASNLTCFNTDSPHVFMTPGGHWNAQGHREVADQINRHLPSFLPLGKKHKTVTSSSSTLLR